MGVKEKEEVGLLTRKPIGRVDPKEAVGRDIVLIIRIGRHAHKAEAGGKALLSPMGEEASEKEGAILHESLPVDKFGLKRYYSEVPRAKRTSDLIGGRADDEKFIKLVPRERKLLSFYGLEGRPVEGGWGGLQKPWIENNYPKYDQLDPDEKDRIHQLAENYSVGQAIQHKVHTLDAAGRLSTLLLRQIRLTGKLGNGSRVLIEERGHEPVLSSFLSECLVIRDPRGGETRCGFQIIEEFGGAFRPLESFDVRVERDKKGGEKISFKFNNPERMKGLECSLDLEKMSRLRDRYLKRRRGEYVKKDEVS